MSVCERRRVKGQLKQIVVLIILTLLLFWIIIVYCQHLSLENERTEWHRKIDSIPLANPVGEYPYHTPEEKAKRVISKCSSVRLGMNADSVRILLGSPDLVYSNNTKDGRPAGYSMDYWIGNDKYVSLYFNIQDELVRVGSRGSGDAILYSGEQDGKGPGESGQEARERGGDKENCGK